MGRDTALGQVVPDVRVQVVGSHNLQQDLECNRWPLGVKQGDADVVEDLTLCHPTGGHCTGGRGGWRFLTVKSVKSVLEIINCKVWFPHILVKTSQVVVIMRKHSIA